MTVHGRVGDERLAPESPRTRLGTSARFARRGATRAPAPFRREAFVAHLKHAKFRSRRNGHSVPVEFPTRRALKNFQRATKEAAEKIENTLGLTGIRVHHVVRAIFRAWLDKKFQVTFTN